MIGLGCMKGETVAVLGLGASGLAAARALVAAGADVRAWDDDDARRGAAAEAGIPIHDLREAEWAAIPSLVLSPGIPHTYPAPHPVVDAAKAAGAEILGDMELLGRARPRARFVGITGTNGKSTTTALLGDALRAAGEPVEVGGNLGPPVLDMEPLGGDGTYVLELSSYQLELIHNLAVDIAVWLNISPDHLDRHGGLEGYVAAKKRIFRGMRPDGTAVIGVDDPCSLAVHDEIAVLPDGPRVVPISLDRPVEGGVFVVGGVLHDAMDGPPRPVLDLRPVARLPGAHNWQNAAAAWAAARAAGIPAETVAEAIRTFPGLAHRQELVAVVDGVAWVNDSKATNAEAASKALSAYDRVHWIAGGRAKEGGIDSLRPLFGRVRHAYLIGDSAKTFAGSLGGLVAHSLALTLERAVAQAARDAESGDTVLLSPACASFDQFRNFEERGDRFRALVEALPGTRTDPTPARDEVNA